MNIKYFTALVSLFLCVCSINTYAQDDVDKPDPIEPIVNDCLNTEDKKGQQECAPLPPNIEIKDLVCSGENDGFATFSLCNLEHEPVTALSIDESSQNFVAQLEPRLPLTIEPKMCVEISVIGIERKDTVDTCNPESKFCLLARANKKPGFDCSGGYGFGYNFSKEPEDEERESEVLVTMSGFVSLYNLIEREFENEE